MIYCLLFAMTVDGYYLLIITADNLNIGEKQDCTTKTTATFDRNPQETPASVGIFHLSCTVELSRHRG